MKHKSAGSDVNLFDQHSVNQSTAISLVDSGVESL